MVNKESLSRFKPGNMIVIACHDMNEFDDISRYAIKNTSYEDALDDIRRNVETQQYRFPWGISVFITEDMDIEWDGYCDIAWYRSNDYRIIEYENVWLPDEPEEPDDFDGISGLSILEFCGFSA